MVDVDAVVPHLILIDGITLDVVNHLKWPLGSAPCHEGAGYCDKREKKEMFHHYSIRLGGGGCNAAYSVAASKQGQDFRGVKAL